MREVDNESVMVSVCLLTYMHGKYIEDCVKGMLAQTYDNMELIILDDASVDDTLQILEKYRFKLEVKFKKVQIYRNKKNTGNISYNLNRMIRHASGKYIKPITGDDVMKHNCIELSVHCMERHPDKIMCYANVYIVGDDFHYGEPVAKKFFYTNHKPYPRQDVFPQLMRLCYISPSILVRRDAYIKYGEYDETIAYEDYDMYLRWSKVEDFIYIRQKLEFYRRGENSLTNHAGKGGKDRFYWMMREENKVIQKHIKALSDEEKKRYMDYFYERFIYTAKKNLFLKEYIVLKWRKWNEYHKKHV